MLAQIAQQKKLNFRSKRQKSSKAIVPAVAGIKAPIKPLDIQPKSARLGQDKFSVDFEAKYKDL